MHWEINQHLILVRGAGDIATGVILRLVMAGFRVIALEAPRPTLIRRTVSLAQCVFDGEVQVEGVCSRVISNVDEALDSASADFVPVMIDPDGQARFALKPRAVVDAILAKKNLGVNLNWAPIVIGLGPGFVAGRDVHAVVETNRGHDLGKVYYHGQAQTDTGIPGPIAGYGAERLVKSPADGLFVPCKSIGDVVESGEVLGWVKGLPVQAALTGVIRGLINEQVAVAKGMKIGDVDPRGERVLCETVSDKARSVGGGVLEAILHFLSR